MVRPICVIWLVVLCSPTLANEHTEEVCGLGYYHLHIYLCTIFLGRKKKKLQKKNTKHKFHSHAVQPVATWLLAFCRSSITGALTMELVYVSSVYSSIFTVASRSWTRINVSLSIHKGEAGEWEHNLETCQMRFLLERIWTQVARSEILHQNNKIQL